MYSDFVPVKKPRKLHFGVFLGQNHTQCTMFGRWGHENSASRWFSHPNDVVWQYCCTPDIQFQPSVFGFCTYEENPKVAFWSLFGSKSNPVHYFWRVGARKQCFQVVLPPERRSLTIVLHSRHPILTQCIQILYVWRNPESCILKPFLAKITPSALCLEGGGTKTVLPGCFNTRTT